MNLLRLMLVLLVAQTPPAPQAARGSIEGFVIKLGTSEPVFNARVVLSRSQGRGESYAATTEIGGRFAFQNLEAGEYRISVTRNGYIRSEYGQRSPNRPGLPLTLNAGQKIPDVVLRLMPAGTIAGRIYDRGGEPLPNVNVQAMRYVYREGNRVLTSVQQARTNDLGEYRLFWLNPGQYYVSATLNDGGRGAGGTGPIAGPGIGGAVVGAPARGGPADGGRGGARGEGRGQRAAAILGALAGMMDTPSEDEGYIPTYFPNTTDAQAAAPIQLQPGVTYPNVDLMISPVRTLRVRGQVVDATTGQPAREVQVMLIPRQMGRGGLGMNPNLRARNPGDQGSFEIRGVVPGSYDVMATTNNRNARLSARVPIEVGGSDVDNVTLVLSPGYPIAGRIAIDGRPATPTDTEIPRIRINLRPDSGAPQGPAMGPPPAAAIQPNGTFTLPQVGQGDYRLNVSGMPQNHYVKAARFGSIDVLSQGLRITGQPSSQLEILISPNTASIEGAVTDDKQRPAVNVTVVLVPEGAFRQRLDLYRVVSTDANGRFNLTGIPPADYRLFAWEDVEQGAWQDPEFTRLYQEYGKAYRLAEGARTTADLRVIPAQM